MNASLFCARRGFTLVELLVTIAILATLTALVMPATSRLAGAADEVKCTSNLRELGVILHTAAIENDNRFPAIENDPRDPIHTSPVQTLAELVQAQGGSPDLLKCPADLRSNGAATGRNASYFKLKGSSYEWHPFFEDENISSPVLRGPFGQFTLPLNRVRLLMDYAERGEAPHDRSGAGTSAMNVLYADGSVRKVVLDDN